MIVTVLYLIAALALLTAGFLVMDRRDRALKSIELVKRGKMAARSAALRSTEAAAKQYPTSLGGRRAAESDWARGIK